MPARLQDVAAAAGVHPATASRALGPRAQELVKAETVARVLRAAQQLDYTPNPIARGLKTQRSATIGIVIPDLCNPLFPPIIRGVEHVASRHGFSSLVANSDNDLEQEERQMRGLRSRQVEGLIISTARDRRGGREELDADLPTVYVIRRQRGSASSSVTGDDAHGVELIVEHLVALGHTKIAHLAGPQDVSAGEERMQAYLTALRRAGLPFDAGMVEEADEFLEQSGLTAARRLLDRRPELTAIVAGNDLLALGCYDLLRERGLSCPDDISITGFNDMPFLDKVAPPLTTARVSKYDIGIEAGEILFGAIDSPTTYRPRHVRMPVELIVRGSTAPARS